MAIAWAISICYIRYPELCLGFLRESRLNDFTYHKSLQKIVESKCVSAEEKERIRKMRRNDLDKKEIEEGITEKKETVDKKRILVVDDNGTTLRTMKAMLEEYYEVTIAISGAQIQVLIHAFHFTNLHF